MEKVSNPFPQFFLKCCYLKQYNICILPERKQAYCNNNVTNFCSTQLCTSHFVTSEDVSEKLVGFTLTQKICCPKGCCSI